MADRQLAFPAARKAQRGAAACNPRHVLLRLARPLSLLTLAGCFATAAAIGTETAQAKQSCSVAAASGHGYWSWRIIDGRKCWYEGKPGLAKSLLEWPARAEAAQGSRRETARVPAAKAGDLLDAQAYEPDESTTFDALWRDRIERH